RKVEWLTTQTEFSFCLLWVSGAAGQRQGRATMERYFPAQHFPVGKPRTGKCGTGKYKPELRPRGGCFRCLSLWFSDADRAAGQATTGVARRLSLQVIGLGVNDNAVTDDRAGAVHFHHRIIVFEAGHSFLIGFDVAHIACVALRRLRRPVLHASRIEMRTGGRAVLRAAIAELVNVEAVLARR